MRFHDPRLIDKTDQELSMVQSIRAELSAVQAIYLFGSWATEFEGPGSDVDIAVLLPPKQAKEIGSLTMSTVHLHLQELLGKDVDLVNLRLVSTVFQKEIIATGRRIFCADTFAVETFEMITFSLYQKLNEERASILDEATKSGRLYRV